MSLDELQVWKYHRLSVGRNCWNTLSWGLWGLLTLEIIYAVEGELDELG